MSRYKWDQVYSEIRREKRSKFRGTHVAVKIHLASCHKQMTYFKATLEQIRYDIVILPTMVQFGTLQSFNVNV